MKRLLMVGLPALAVVALVALVVTAPSEAQVKKGKERPLRTKTLMSGVVKPNCAGLGKGLGANPTSDEDWAALRAKAELLNECGHVLMADGRCPDKDWKGAAETLQGCSDVIIKKIDEKDAEGAQKAFMALTKACGACHGKHKKKQ